MKERILSNPKLLFLIDGFGAIVSAFLLGVVLVIFENQVGIPSKTLYFLASIPVVFFFYDMYGYTVPHQKTNIFLKGIAFLNLLYCFVSLGFAWYHSNRITILGWSYIITELLILGALIYVEYLVAENIKSKIKE